MEGYFFHTHAHSIKFKFLLSLTVITLYFYNKRLLIWKVLNFFLGSQIISLNFYHAELSTIFSSMIWCVFRSCCCCWIGGLLLQTKWSRHSQRNLCQGCFMSVGKSFPLPPQTNSKVFPSYLSLLSHLLNSCPKCINKKNQS